MELINGNSEIIKDFFQSMYLQVICRCSSVQRPVLPVIPTTSPDKTACPCDTEI